jgi:hypothetical protein
MAIIIITHLGFALVTGRFFGGGISAVSDTCCLGTGSSCANFSKLSRRPRMPKCFVPLGTAMGSFGSVSDSFGTASGSISLSLLTSLSGRVFLEMPETWVIPHFLVVQAMEGEVSFHQTD